MRIKNYKQTTLERQESKKWLETGSCVIWNLYLENRILKGKYFIALSEREMNNETDRAEKRDEIFTGAS